MKCYDWKHINILAQIFFFLPLLFETEFINWYFWDVWMDMGVRGESDLRGAYCVSVDCRVGRSALSSQWQSVNYPRTVLLITPSFVIARAESPWRSTVSGRANRIIRTRPLYAVDCRVGHLGSLLAMTKWDLPSNRTFNHSHFCHREGWKARGDPLWSGKGREGSCYE